MRTSSVALLKRSSMLAVTRRYRRKSTTLLRKLRKVQYRSRSCTGSSTNFCRFTADSEACLLSG